MYGASVEKVEQASEDEGKLKEFEARISRGEKIEPGDWMPAEYRRQLVRMISQHAHSEIVGMLPEGAWIGRAPSLRRKMILLAKVQDEAGHGQYLYHAAETLGVTREEMEEALLSGKAKYSSVFNYPTLNWTDVGVIGYLVDYAAILNQTMLARCSYGPYSRAMVRISAEENFHKKQGQDLVIRMAGGTPMQKAMVQDAINRWWWPTLMMFGPHDSDSPNSGVLMRWGIKTRSNDELRQEFLDQIIPELQALGLSVPDPDLRYDEASQHWIPGEIDWDEFWRVVKGQGPCNRERMEARRSAHEQGRWVREALAAYKPKFYVFQQEKPEARYLAVGSVHAADGELALFNARDVFARRPECAGLWVVPAEKIFAKTAEELEGWKPAPSSEGAQAGKTYHVFVKDKHAGTHEQAGTIEAATPEAAMQAAIQKFGLQHKGLVWWLFPAQEVTASSPEDIASWFDPAREKIYRQSSDFKTVTAMRKIREK